MNKKVYLACLFVIVKSVQSLKLLSKQVNNNMQQQSNNDNDQKIQRRILEILANTQSFLFDVDRRSVDLRGVKKAKTLFDLLPSNNKGGLRDKNVGIEKFASGVNVEHQVLVENELEDSLTNPKSVLLHNARVQKRGRNDFLVLEDTYTDPFVTIIPNNIYYNAEKKCVNWMDDCSLQGIRSRLLSKVRSPYK